MTNPAVFADEPDDLVCDLTGTPATPDEIASIDPADDLGLPIGWLAVTVTRRVPNPKYAALVMAREMELAGMLQQIPANVQGAERDAVTAAFAVKLDAQYRALTGDPEYAPTVTEEATKIIAPIARVPDLATVGAFLTDTMGYDRRLIRPTKRKPAQAAPQAAPSSTREG